MAINYKQANSSKPTNKTIAATIATLAASYIADFLVGYFHLSNDHMKPLIDVLSSIITAAIAYGAAWFTRPSASDQIVQA